MAKDTVNKNKNKYYHISTVANIYNVHPQTLRLYEREGLLKPSRSKGNTRLYSEEDLERLEFILNLTRDLGVNLAGVEVAINMKKNMERMEKEVNEFLNYIRMEFFEGREEEFETKKDSLVRLNQTKIIKIEKTKNNRE
ncbi:MAG: helix-turn-helix transcriptional regulator [Candidatus Aminicenantes bacterium]|nr:helix-turn-helix transcriptional regulator [Candidatus Aminicenantes bacterium]